MSKSRQRGFRLRAKPKISLAKKKKRIHQLKHPCGALPEPPVLQSAEGTSSSSSWASALWRWTGVAKPLLATASCLCRCCMKAVTHIFQIIRSPVFRSHACQQELNSLRERLGKLEAEFSRWQSLIQDGAVAPPPPGNPAGQSSEVPALPLLGLRGLVLARPASLTSHLVVTPAPPPPPPPLPPPPPPFAPLFLKRNGGTKTQAASLNKDVPMQITPRDLLNVKLKKTQSGTEASQKKSPLERRKALVTLSDLRSVSLKAQATRPTPRMTNHLITPGKTGLDLRKHLKKVAIERSPGGTPLTNKENVETGTGLTPIMTQALRRKFQLAHPKSPSPARLTAANSFEEPT